MSHSASESEKCVTGGNKDTNGLTVRVSGEQSSKKMKQARLPFKPLTPSPVVNAPSSRKRKHSIGGDSPKGKQSKHPDVHQSAEKVKLAALPHDNEVSSSSEAETGNGTKAKSKNNLLEQFVHRDNEISSTIDVVDLTDATEEQEIDENKPVSVKSPCKSPLKLPGSPGVRGKSEDHFARKLEFEEKARDKEKTSDNKSRSFDSASPVEDQDDDVMLVTDNDSDNNHTIEEEDGDNKDQSLSVSPLETSVTDADVSKNDEAKVTPLRRQRQSPQSASTPQTGEKGSTSANKKKLDKRQEGKSALRQKVKEEKEKLKQLAKDQKEKERLEKKQKQDEEKAEKERLKKEEKDKKEKEKQEKKEQSDREKQEKVQQKEEERKKKQELLDAKAEEKQKKEEEKKLRDLQKQKEEEEKLKQVEKRKAAFTSFFLKQKTLTTTKVEKAVENSLFIPFELKKDMTLAPVKRQELSSEKKECMDKALACGNPDITYLQELKGIRKPKPRINRILRKKKEAEQEVELLVHDSEAVKKVTRAVKLLQFHTDYRPPYYGTWRKSPVLFPRNPWKKDEKTFDYEVDSDEEWEEEEPGESLSDSNGEEEEGGEDDEEGEEDGWMVPHGYLSEGEGCEDDEEVTPEILKAQQRAKAQAWEVELKAKKEVKPPLCIGCFWLDQPCTVQAHINILQQFEMFPLRAFPIETLVSNPSFVDGVADNGADKPVSKSFPRLKGLRKRALPEEAMPDLIRLVHGNTAGIKKLVREFRLYWRQKSDANSSLDESKMEDAYAEAVDKTTIDSRYIETAKTEIQNVCESGNEQQGAATIGTSSAIEKADDVSDKVSNTPGKENNHSFVSKRQLEIKIMAIGVRDKRVGCKKTCWYVNDDILKKFGLVDLPIENKWVFISGDVTKKTPSKSGDAKIGDALGEKSSPDSKGDTSTTLSNSKLEDDQDSPPKSMSKKNGLKDQPTIMAFAKKTQGTPNLKKMKTYVRKVLDTTEIIDVDMEVDGIKDESPVGEYTHSSKRKKMDLGNTFPLLKDQPSIMVFAKKTPSKICQKASKTSDEIKTDVKNVDDENKPDHGKESSSIFDQECIVLD